MIIIILTKDIKLNELSVNDNSNYIEELLIDIISEAVLKNASDIHIEPNEDSFLIRFRIYGELEEIIRLDIEQYNQLSTVIKLKGNMNISEKRLPQDGRMDFIINEESVDVRISSTPIIHGEKIVLRILNNQDMLSNQEALGFRSEDIQRINNIINKKSGILLVTGATGSGKTTTVYSILKTLIDSSKNIMTIEDPIEYKIEGINQIQVNHKVGLDFELGLKSILRQDPDVIMIGEIRDIETARTAMRAAITGHLVITTMHTNDSISSIFRLKDMGVKNYLISSSIIGVISQTLVKKICDTCGHEIIIENVGQDSSHQVALGCNECNYTGYNGRTIDYEILEIDKEISKLINDNATYNEIKEKALELDKIIFKQDSKMIKECVLKSECYEQ